MNLSHEPAEPQPEVNYAIQNPPPHPFERMEKGIGQCKICFLMEKADCHQLEVKENDIPKLKDEKKKT